METVAQQAVVAPASPGAPEAPVPAPERRYRVEFTATAGEYFRIWIVNLALTIATLGVFSAWAKVRSKRYFYGHTRIDGDAFDYRGRPLAILKGRLVAAGALGSFYAAAWFAPVVLWALVPALLLAIPWLMVRSLAFNAHNSAIRGLRLRFHGTYGACLRIFLAYGLLTVLTLGLGYYVLKARLTEFIVRQHAWGATRFEVPKLTRPFSKAYARAILMGFLGFTTLSAVVFWLLKGGTPRGSISPLAMNVVVYAFYLWLFAYLRARVLNATFDAASLGGVRFRSTLGARRLYALYVTNIVAIVLTVGLATPWAIVRTMRYRAGCLEVIAPAGLDHFAAAAGGEVPAAGEEVAEMLDYDFSL